MLARRRPIGPVVLRPAGGRDDGRDLAATAAVAVGVVAHHLVDHLVVPVRYHVATHAVAAAAAVGAGRAVGLTLDDLGLDPDRLGDGLRVGALAAAVDVGVVVGVGLAPPTRGAFADEAVAATPVGTLVRRGVLDIPVGTAVYEEVVFRGVLLALADRHLPPAAATAVVSAGFGLWHVLPTLRDVGQRPAAAGAPRWVVVAGTVAATAAAGVGFTWLRRRSGSVLAPALAHAAVNVAALAIAADQGRRRGTAADQGRRRGTAAGQGRRRGAAAGQGRRRGTVGSGDDLGEGRVGAMEQQGERS